MKKVDEELKVLFTKSRQSTAAVIKAYGEKLTAEQTTLLGKTIEPVIARLDKLDVISDTDGFQSAVEGLQELQKLLSEEGNLKDVLTSLKEINLV